MIVTIRNFQIRAVTALLLLLLAACSNAPYKHAPFDEFDLDARAVSQQKGAITVRASVPGDDEAEKLFGIPLQKRGIQAVWMEIFNDSDRRARFAPYSVDPAYFTPHEVAYMYRKQFSKKGWQEMESRFFSDSLPRYIKSGETVSGFVFTNAVTGTKAFNVDIFYSGNKSEYEHFTFFLTVPGFQPDHAEIDFKTIYNNYEYKDLDVNSFREYIAALPCCTTNSAGNAQGQPIILALVADGKSLLRALLRANWKETSYKREDAYLKSANHLFDRPPDAVFRKGRDKTTERNELGVWLAPVSVDGVPVWFAQVKHAIGRRFEIEEAFFGVRIDPDVDDGRNYMLQDMWYAQSLEKYAWSKTGIEVPKEAPVVDFNDNAWFSDGLRMVLWVSGEPVSLGQTRDMKWDKASGDGAPIK